MVHCVFVTLSFQLIFNILLQIQTSKASSCFLSAVVKVQVLATYSATLPNSI